MKKRPLAVTIIAWIFVLVGIVTCVSHASEIQPYAIRYDDVAAVGISLVAVLCGIYMLRGSDWARWLAVAWLAFHVILSGFHSRRELIVHTVLLAMFAYFLFRPEATAYFRGARREGA